MLVTANAEELSTTPYLIESTISDLGEKFSRSVKIFQKKMSQNQNFYFSEDLNFCFFLESKNQKSDFSEGDNFL